MKIDINYKFRTIEGEVVKNQVMVKDKLGNPVRDIQGFPQLKNGGDFTLRQACERSLLDPPVTNQKTGQQEPIAGDEKIMRWNLAKTIHDSTGLIDLQSEEITLLKGLIDKKYPSSPLVYAQACEVLDPTDPPNKSKK